MNNRFIIWEQDDIEEPESSPKDAEEMQHGESTLAALKMFQIPIVYHTNFGTFNSHSPNNPYLTRDVFLAHTSFTLTEEELTAISEVEGVEGIRALTRYSFGIVIGKLFKPSDVIEEIDELLNVETFENFDLDETIKDNSELLQNVATEMKDKKYWNVYIFPNGEKLMEEYENEDKMSEREVFFKGLSILSFGLLVTSKNSNQ